MAKFLYSIALIVLLLSSIHIGQCSSGEIDGVAVVTNVHDGDTFYIDVEFNGSNIIRLADINASELGQPNSYESRDFLAELVNQTTVYLDIDDKYTFDYYGTGDRLVCVVYVSYNETHYMNVNKALLDAGLAEEKEYDNEFNASTWTLLVFKSEVPIVPEFPHPFLIVIAFALASAAIVLHQRAKILNL